MNTDSSDLLAFYLGAGTDKMERRLDEILRKDDGWLEETHDYIQWLFPLYVRSKFNDLAPLLTDEVRRSFLLADNSVDERLQTNFSAAIDRMLLFYGYERHADSGEMDPVRKAPNWEERSWNWLTPGNHNHLRMTRMLRCMTLLGRHPLAMGCREAWAAAGLERSDCLSRETLAFWKEAVETAPESDQ